MTIQPGKSRGKDKLKGEIEIAQRRIWEALYVGWPALAQSWMDTLEEKLHDNETRLDGPPPERLDYPG